MFIKPFREKKIYKDYFVIGQTNTLEIPITDEADDNNILPKLYKEDTRYSTSRKHSLIFKYNTKYTVNFHLNGLWISTSFQNPYIGS